MFHWDNVCPFQSEQEHVVCPYHLGVLAALHGLDKDGVTIDFHHNHNVLVASKRSCRELAYLIGGHGFAYHVRLGIHIAHFLAVEMEGVVCFQWRCLCFGQMYVLSCLIQMSLCSFDCLGVVLLDIVFSQHWSARVVAHVDGFEPSLFDQVSSDGMHPFDGVLSQCEIIDAVGLM
jgi:hypothetical protein